MVRGPANYADVRGYNPGHSMVFRCCGAAILLGLALFPVRLPAQGPPPQGESNVVGEVFASDASVQGSVIFASGGMRLLSGSTVSAGAATATVRLKRGGEVRVCPGSNVQVNSVASQGQQRDLVLSLDTGMLEAHYSLSAGSDSVVTPDFRITLTGPGEFHVAIGADAHGNTCVQPLRGNNSAIIVNELMGEGSYQVKPNLGMYFLSGRVKAAVAEVPTCGCPAPVEPRPLETAQQPATPASPERTAQAGPTQPMADSVTQPLPATRPNDVSVQVDAPVVFNAADPGPSLEMAQLVQLPLTQVPWFFTDTVVLPPVVQVSAPPPSKPKDKEKKKGFFGRLRGMFASIFGK